MKFKAIMSGMMLISLVSVASTNVCEENPGNVTCSKGTIDKLTGNGAVFVHRTTVNGPTHVNGMLTADQAHFSRLNVNGSVTLTKCAIKEFAEIKGNLNVSSTKFDRDLSVYSRNIRLINSKINNNLHIHHTDNLKQVVYLDNHSEVGGDIIFDDGHGKVYAQGGSKIVGKVIGGKIVGK